MSATVPSPSRKPPTSTPSTPSKSAVQQNIATMFANVQRSSATSKAASPVPSDKGRPGTASPRKRLLEDDGNGGEDIAMSGNEAITFSVVETGDTVKVESNDSGSKGFGDVATEATKSATTNSNKRRKLTQAEKEGKEKQKAEKVAEKEREKEEKKRLADEAKKKKEEEKKQKEEEKRIREEEKKKIAEGKERKREEKKRQEEEEKAKKERSQTKLSSFFGKPKDSATASPSKPKLIPPSCGRTAAVDGAAQSTEQVKQEKTDYEKYFQPFFIKQHTILSHRHWFVRDKENKKYIKQNLDNILGPQYKPRPTDAMDIDDCDTVKGKDPLQETTQAKMLELLHLPEYEGRRGALPKHSTKELLAKVNQAEARLSLGNSNGKSRAPQYYLELIKSLPQKHLQFAEDARPPYSGTFTRVPPPGSKLRSGKNPFERSLPNINYDYDSEAEWIPAEEEEGEELLSEGEEEEDSQDDDEMDEFLDDEEDIIKRNVITAPLQPFSTGLYWEDERGRNWRKEFKEMKMGVLIEGISAPIDPFSTSYWLPPPKVPSSRRSKETTGTKTDSNTIAVSMTNLRRTHSAISTSLPLSPHFAKPQGSSASSSKKLIPPEDMEAFKKAIEGSDMTKAGLVEVLKKKFPKASKDAIRETLAMVAVREGKKEADKRWVLK